MKSEKNILIAFILNFAFSIFEFFGGIFTGSVAILSDAVHDIGDATSIGLSYFLEKKSVYSMLTALTGAVVNVVLNFVMIPHHGAMGAAAATLISYVTVYAVRVVDTRRYVKFNTHNVRLVLTSALILAQSFILLMGIRYSLYLSGIIFLLVAALNLGGILSTSVRILRVFAKK